MTSYIKFFGFLAILSLAAIVSIGQTPAGGAKNSVVTGEILAVAADKVVLRTAEGELAVILSDKTEYRRVPPDNPVLKAAVAAELSDLDVGDKLLVTGLMSEDKKSLPAKAVYLMTKSDIAQRNQKDREKWATRGISGQVKSINAETRQITIDVSRLGTTASVVLTPKDGVRFMRYAENSVDYAKAVPSGLGDIAPGDMIRALGDRSQDGASFAAEEIITGSFETIAGTVKSFDAEKNELIITDVQSKKDITVALGSASLLKRFPEQMAQMLAARQGGAAGPGGGAQGPPTQQAAPQQMTARPMQGGAGGPGGPGGPGGGPRGGIDEMLDRFPNISGGDLKEGEMVAVSSSKRHAVDRINAIKLLAGVEPFIRAAQMSAAMQRGRQTTQSLSIPGLDGFDMP